jgi:hypothetical protein
MADLHKLPHLIYVHGEQNYLKGIRRNVRSLSSNMLGHSCCHLMLSKTSKTTCIC